MVLALPATLTRTRSPFAIAAERLTPDSERAELDREREAAMADVRVFASHARIADPTGREIAFGAVGWAWQFALLALWAVERLTVVLKARQLGVTWLAAIFALWMAIRARGQTVLLISQRQDDADKFLAKVAYVYERLPAWRPPARVGTRSIAFPTLGSEIEAMPAVQNIGRSRTANLVVLDEHAHQPFAQQIFAAVGPAAESGQMLSLSTGKGKGTLHSKLFLGALGSATLAATTLSDGTPLPLQVTPTAGPNGWRGVFVPFSARAGRDDDWRASKRAELSQLSDPEFIQEYPRTALEAIAETGSPVFAPERLEAQELRAGSPIEGVAGAVVYEAAAPGERYVIGADPAEGLVDSDWSSATVLRVWQEDDGYAADQVAVLRGRWAPEVFAAKLDRLARYYGCHAGPALRQPVLLAWERNNHGHAVRVALEATWSAAAPYAMYRGRDKRLGWLQTSESRTILVDQLAAAVRNGTLSLHDAVTVDQFATFHENEKGRPEAMEGAHDDDVIAIGIAWIVRRLPFGRVLGAQARKAA